MLRDETAPTEKAQVWESERTHLGEKHRIPAAQIKKKKKNTERCMKNKLVKIG